MPHTFFDISKKECLELSEDKIKNLDSYKWEKFDESCDRCSINLPIKMIQYLYDKTNLPFSVELKNTVNHYVKYNVHNSYTIGGHNDGCKITF